MDKLIKSAILVACVAVTIAAGVFFWDRYQVQQRAAALDRSLQEAQTHQHVSDCKRYVAQWNSGQRGAVRSVFGSQSNQIITGCEISISLADRAKE